MTTAAPENKTAPYLPPAKNGASALLPPDVQTFVRQADAFLSDETNWDDDCLRPTPRALQTLFHLLINAAQETALPSGILYPDENGGLRLEWRSLQNTADEKYLLLAVHASDKSRDCLYYQTGNVRGDLEAVVSAETLVCY